MNPFDKVIVASNEDPAYIDFWPIVSWCYRAMFPWASVELALLSNRTPGDLLLSRLAEFGVVHVFPIVDGIAQKHQSKMLMHAAPQLSPDTVCYVDGIDYIPINRDWILGFVNQRESGRFLLVGSEVYKGQKQLPPGIMPSSHMTAEGWMFQELTNPDMLPWEEWLLDIPDIRSAKFMEEEAIAKIRNSRDVAVDFQEIPRNLNVARDTIDRATWSAIDRERLGRGEFKRIHSPRPYRDYAAFYAIVEEWVIEHYNAETPPPNTILSREFDLGPPINVAPPAQRKRGRRSRR